MYTFRINGSVHHNIGSLVPAGQNKHAFAQIYFLDGEEQVQRRNELFSDLNRITLQDLQAMLHECNAYVEYKQAYQTMSSNSEGNIQMVLHADLPNQDGRRYNAPTAPEFAVLMPGDGNNNGTSSRDIVIQERIGGINHINETHKGYDSIH